MISLDSLKSKWIIEQGKTMAGGIPIYIKVKPSIISHFEGFQFQNLQKTKISQINSKIYIQVNFKDYKLSEFDRVKHLINKCAYDEDLYQLLPFLFRLIFEKLLYQIYLTSLDNNHKLLYFSHRPRDFSQLINLLNILKDREFYPYHGGSINQEIISILKEVQKKGNFTVHQIIRQIDKEYRNNWREKIDRALENLLVLYRNLPENKILIEDIDRLEKIKEVLGIIPSYSNSKRGEQLKDISSSEISTIMSKIRLLIDESDLHDNRLNIRSKMDELLLAVKSLNLKNKKIEAIRKMYILFNSALETYPPLKLTLQTLLDTINILIL